MNIEIKAIYISPGHDFKGRFGQERLNHGVLARDSITCLASRGIEGDRYLDFKPDFKGQITFFDWSVFEAIKSQFHQADLDPACFRRNVVVAGLDLNTLIGQRFQLQGIHFEGSEACAPCQWMDTAIAPGAEVALKNRGGLRARILNDGMLHRGQADFTVSRQDPRQGT